MVRETLANAEHDVLAYMAFDESLRSKLHSTNPLERVNKEIRRRTNVVGIFPKGPDWANMGRSLVRGMLNSARGISDKDQSPQAQAARRIGGFADLDGIEFVARIDVGSDAMGEEKNEIRAAVTPDHRDYAQVMGLAAQHGYQPPAQTAPQQAPVQQPAASPVPGRPAWAQ